MSAGEIAKGLTLKERRADWVASGRTRVPSAVWSLHEKGLLYVWPAIGGWGWKPTPEGTEVRAHLQENPGHE